MKTEAKLLCKNVTIEISVDREIPSTVWDQILKKAAEIEVLANYCPINSYTKAKTAGRSEEYRAALDDVVLGAARAKRPFNKQVRHRFTQPLPTSASFMLKTWMKTKKAADRYPGGDSVLLWAMNAYSGNWRPYTTATVKSIQQQIPAILAARNILLGFGVPLSSCTVDEIVAVSKFAIEMTIRECNNRGLARTTKYGYVSCIKRFTKLWAEFLSLDYDKHIGPQLTVEY